MNEAQANWRPSNSFTMSASKASVDSVSLAEERGRDETLTGDRVDVVDPARPTMHIRSRDDKTSAVSGEDEQVS